MATDGVKVVLEALRILQDPNPEDPVAPYDALCREVNEKVSILCSKDHLGLGTVWVRPLFALVAGNDDYDLPAASVGYEQVLDLKFSDNVTLAKRSREFVQQLRQGSPLPTGRPSYCALSENEDRSLMAEVYPVPEAGEVVNALVSLQPAVWLPNADPPTINFSPRAVLALQKLVAVSIGRTLGRDKLIALDLNPRAFDAWESEAMELVRLERLRIIRLKRSHGPANYAWVSEWVG